MSLLSEYNSKSNILINSDVSSDDKTKNLDSISKQLLINYLNKKLEDNPICYYNDSVHEYSKGFRKPILELLEKLK